MFGINEVDATGLKSLIDSGETIRLIDVRSSAEYNQGIIKGGEFMPLHTLPLKLNDLPKDQKVVFYCRSGARSAQACMFASQNAGIDAINLRGGIIAWARAGYNLSAPETNVA